jgi:hypothetical protein
MDRVFNVKTSFFRPLFPAGTSPSDSENINLVKRFYKSATGAEDVQVKLYQGPDGDLLTDLYDVSITHPTVLADGHYVRLKHGALDGQAAEILGRIIKSLANNQDASADIQKLQEVAKGGANKEEVKPEEGSATGPTGMPPGTPAKGGPGGPGGGFPGAKSEPSADALPEKKKMPFAKKNSKLRRAMILESKLNIPLKDGIKLAGKIRTDDFENFVNRVIAVQAHEDLGLDLSGSIQLVAMVDGAQNWKDFVKKASQTILDENNKPLTTKEYAEIAKIARGEETAPLA